MEPPDGRGSAMKWRLSDASGPLKAAMSRSMGSRASASYRALFSRNHARSLCAFRSFRNRKKLGPSGFSGPEEVVFAATSPPGGCHQVTPKMRRAPISGAQPRARVERRRGAPRGLFPEALADFAPLDVLDERVEVLRAGGASGAPSVKPSEAKAEREQAPCGACDPGGHEARSRLTSR